MCVCDVAYFLMNNYLNSLKMELKPSAVIAGDFNALVIMNLKWRFLDEL